MRRWSGAGLIAGVIVLILVTAAGPSVGQGRPRIVVFSQQQVQTTPFEMAQEQGYYAEEGLEVVFRYFASGTTAWQSFRAGAGDIVYSGDVPAIRNWAESGRATRVIAPVERNARGYGLVVRRAIRSAADLRGKRIAIRVGSSGSHFIWAYLRKHGMTERDVTIVNMDAPAAVAALDRGDIDGFFFWAPFPQRALEVSGDRVHILAHADAVGSGYYTMISARGEWIRRNRAIVDRFLAASVRGREYAQRHKSQVLAYLNRKFQLDVLQAGAMYDVTDLLLRFDERFYQDLGSVADWMRETGLLSEPLVWSEFVYLDGLRGVDRALAVPPPKQ
ncbi:MAG: ABC transporter substrate-binding protein [Armatimonadota bacterium]|nr:ABC transporter substrate-binding protein [Armatimonadota bacterium]